VQSDRHGEPVGLAERQRPAEHGSIDPETPRQLARLGLFEVPLVPGIMFVGGIAMGAVWLNERRKRRSADRRQAMGRSGPLADLGANRDLSIC
jgi:hypothetical protein